MLHHDSLRYRCPLKRVLLMYTVAMIAITTILCGMWLQFGIGALWLELAICSILFAPVAVLGFGNLYHMCRQKEGFHAEVKADYLQEVAKAEQRAKEETIQFVGHVLPGRGRPCVCSWPGKYLGLEHYTYVPFCDLISF